MSWFAWITGGFVMVGQRRVWVLLVTSVSLLLAACNGAEEASPADEQETAAVAQDEEDKVAQDEAAATDAAPAEPETEPPEPEAEPAGGFTVTVPNGFQVVDKIDDDTSAAFRGMLEADDRMSGQLIGVQDASGVEAAAFVVITVEDADLLAEAELSEFVQTSIAMTSAAIAAAEGAETQVGEGVLAGQEVLVAGGHDGLPGFIAWGHGTDTVVLVTANPDFPPDQVEALVAATLDANS